MRHSSAFFLGLGALTGALVLGAGCQPSTTSSSGLSGGGFGGTGPSSNGSTGATTGTQGSTTGSGASSSTSGTGGTGGMAVDATIQDITTAAVGTGIAVKLTGVVAMSHKFLISQSKTSGSCLWGVFISAPGLTETAANTGLLATSYGTNATIADGGTTAFCPVVGLSPVGDGFPDDVAPGDVLTIVGKTDYFNIHQKVPTDCVNAAIGESLVAQYQLSGINPGAVTRTATAGAVPAPHAVTMAEIAQLASATDKGYHDQWGGVKVKVTNVTSVAQAPVGDAGPAITDQFGNMVMMGSNLQVGDKIFYQGLLKKNDICHAGPVYANDMTTFTEIDGFSYLNFCTWGLVPGSRCSDFKPGSDDCGTNTCL